MKLQVFILVYFHDVASSMGTGFIPTNVELPLSQKEGFSKCVFCNLNNVRLSGDDGISSNL